MTNDIREINLGDDEWPTQLNSLFLGNDGPTRLWVRGGGNLVELAHRSVAVVGARAATSYGTHVASDIAQGVVEYGWTVVSGGAFGIDAAAHRGALAAGQDDRLYGPTIVVLPCGLNHDYPAAHRDLFSAIAGSGGLLVSEYAPDQPPMRHRFLARNRIIAALTRGTVLVEATERSGSRQAFGHARRLGRKLMVVPGPVTSSLSAGTLAELRERDTVPVGSAADVLAVLNG